jgi:hypothetical protein
MRVAVAPPGWRFVDGQRDGGTVFRREGDTTGPVTPHNGKARRPEAEAPPCDWAKLAAQYRDALDDAAAQRWAERLGVSVEALRLIGAGQTAGDTLTVPEHDGAGRVVGISTRAADGRKSAMKGSRRGLVLPADLGQPSDPVLVVEGASDVAAALTLGLAAVGRSSCAAGAEMVAELLQGREVMVVGERDEKSDGRWPGRDGARSVAAKLAERWGRPVRWTLPPAPAKDLRAWLLAVEALERDEAADMTAAGRELLAAMEAAAVQGGTVAGAAMVPAAGAPPAGPMTRSEALEAADRIGALARAALQNTIDLALAVADWYDRGGPAAVARTDGMPATHAFLAARIDCSRQRVGQLVEAGRTLRACADVPVTGSLTERALRPLARLPLAERSAALARAVKLSRTAWECEEGRRAARGLAPRRGGPSVREVDCRHAVAELGAAPRKGGNRGCPLVPAINRLAAQAEAECRHAVAEQLRVAAELAQAELAQAPTPDVPPDLIPVRDDTATTVAPVVFDFMGAPGAGR